MFASSIQIPKVYKNLNIDEKGKVGNKRERSDTKN